MRYKAVIVCVIFDEKYDFESVSLLGISHSYSETLYLMHNDILRLMEDFDEPHKIELETSRDLYEEPITIAHHKHGHAHYYCLFIERPEEKT